MCKRSCLYNGKYFETSKKHTVSCSFCLVPENAAEGRTRTGLLAKKYNLPTNHPLILWMLKGENCEFFVPQKQKGAE